MFKGTYTAIVTPFTQTGRIDYNSLEKLIEFQIENNITGIVPVGTTGESPTLSHKEHTELIEFVCKTVNNRCQVIAGTGSNSTTEAINLTANAKDLGVTASLQVAPYYNKPTQRGIYLHYKTIAEKVDLPLIVYNIAGRTGRNITTDTLVEMAKLPNIVGVKEASGNMLQMLDVINETPEDFSVLAGDDAFTLPLIAAGGTGVISVTSNIVPRKMVDLVQAGLDGDFQRMRRLNYELLPLFKILTIEQNPLPIKTALALAGSIEGNFRLPLCEMEPANRSKLKDFLESQGII